MERGRENAWYPEVGYAVTREPLAISWKITLIKSEAPGGQGREGGTSLWKGERDKNLRVCPGSSPHLESGLPSICSLPAWGREEGPGPKTSDLDRPCRYWLPGVAEGPWGRAPRCSACAVPAPREHPLLRFDFLPFLSRVYNFTNE